MAKKECTNNIMAIKSSYCVLCTNSEVHIYIFVIQESKGPKAVIAIKDLNVTFQPEKIGHPHGLQITYQDNDHTRNLYVYHESPEVGLHDHPK